MLLTNKIVILVRLSSTVSSKVYIKYNSFYSSPSNAKWEEYPLDLILQIYSSQPDLHEYMLNHLYLTFFDDSEKSFKDFANEHNLLR